MQIFVHRVNTLEKLATVPRHYGVEIDVRGYGDTLLLTHDPVGDPSTLDNLPDFIAAYHHAGIIFNMKEAGYEQKVIDLATVHGIENYFLLDVEFPYLYRATRRDGFRNIAVRYSEAEPIEAVIAQTHEGIPLLDWVWIDTNTRLPLSTAIVAALTPFKTCLVSPDRWGRPEDIPQYIDHIKELGFPLTAVMTELKYAPLWEAAFA